MDNAVFAAAGLEQNLGWGLAWMNVTQKENHAGTRWHTFANYMQ